jgi:hypothetical protein
MIELCFRFTVKGTVLRNNFATCYGGPIYSPEVYSRIRQIRKTGSTSRVPLFEKS